MLNISLQKWKYSETKVADECWWTTRQALG